MYKLTEIKILKRYEVESRLKFNIFDFNFNVLFLFLTFRIIIEF